MKPDWPAWEEWRLTPPYPPPRHDTSDISACPHRWPPQRYIAPGDAENPGHRWRRFRPYDGLGRTVLPVPPTPLIDL